MRCAVREHESLAAELDRYWEERSRRAEEILDLLTGVDDDRRAPAGVKSSRSATRLLVVGRLRLDIERRVSRPCGRRHPVSQPANAAKATPSTMSSQK
jgi:hypothetical protein